MVVVVLRTLFSRFLLLLIMIVYAVPFCVFICLPKKWLIQSRLFFACAQLFYWFLLKFSFLPITIKGAQNIPATPTIFVANHQSSLDIPLIGSLMHAHPHTWLAKSELREESYFLSLIVPKIGVLIDMSTPQKAMRSLVNAVNAVTTYKNNHVILFPEGARFVDGQIHDFFSGFVILAKKTGRPVVPIRLFDLNVAYPPNSFWVQRVPITVVVGSPMFYHKDDTDESFKERVYNWFVMQKRN